MSRESVLSWAQERYEDLDFRHVRAHVEAGGKAAGFLPVYAPKEVIHAAGMLPVGIHGGGDRLEIIRGDAFYQSYICHLPRSVIELQQSGRLSMLSALVFPSTCDVIRNLSGMWKVLEPNTYVRYCDLPQVQDRASAGVFWRHELHTLFVDLCRVAGVEPDPERLRASIRVYNEVRATLLALYEARRDAPHKVPSEELYVLVRAGEVSPPEEFVAQGRAYLDAVAKDDSKLRDRVRVVVMGAFCEQPPLGLIKTLERAGCFIVDDDFVLGNRLVHGDVPTDGDPLDALTEAFLAKALPSSILYEHDPNGKRRLVEERVKAARADGILFAAPSFCDPALLDRPMLKAGAEAAGIPCIAFQYSENTGQFQQFREQAGTFSDSIKLWSAT
jgi:benzoyl-CoA reductase subunit C